MLLFGWGKRLRKWESLTVLKLTRLYIYWYIKMLHTYKYMFTMISYSSQDSLKTPAFAPLTERFPKSQASIRYKPPVLDSKR